MFNPKGLNAEFAPETEQRSEQRKQMNLDAKRPKAERRYQHATHMAELTAKEKALKEQLSDENEQLQTINRQLETDNQKQNDENIALAIKSSELAMENDELDQQITKSKRTDVLKYRRSKVTKVWFGDNLVGSWDIEYCCCYLVFYSE